MRPTLLASIFALACGAPSAPERPASPAELFADLQQRAGSGSGRERRLWPEAMVVRPAPHPDTVMVIVPPPHPDTIMVWRPRP